MRVHNVYTSLQYIGRNVGVPGTFYDLAVNGKLVKFENELKMGRLHTTNLLVLEGDVNHFQNDIPEFMSLGKWIDINISLANMISYPIYNNERITINIIINPFAIELNYITLLAKYTNVYFIFELPNRKYKMKNALDLIAKNDYSSMIKGEDRVGLLYDRSEFEDEDATRQMFGVAFNLGWRIYFKNIGRKDLYEDAILYRHTL